MYMQTQWHIGLSGRTGLIYSEAWKWMTEQGITKRKQRQDVMWCLQVMEGEALRVWAEQHKD